MKEGRKIVKRRMEQSFEKYGWTEEQQKRFKDFVEERYAKYSKPVNTILSYLAVLSHVVEHVKKPFSIVKVTNNRKLEP